jgi:hypothetical protein
MASSRTIVSGRKCVIDVAPPSLLCGDIDHGADNIALGIVAEHDLAAVDLGAYQVVVLDENPGAVVVGHHIHPWAARNLVISRGFLEK